MINKDDIAKKLAENYERLESLYQEYRDNPKLAVETIELMRLHLETASSFLKWYEIEKTKDALLDNIRTVDPALAEKIKQDIRALREKKAKERGDNE